MFNLILSFIVGLLTIPVLMFLLPSKTSNDIKKENFALKLNSRKNLNIAQATCILKSLHKCTDLYWLNVLISRFWMELAESHAQTYRMRGFIRKFFEYFTNNGMIKSIEVEDVFIGNESPYIESIEILSEDDVNKIFRTFYTKESNILMEDELSEIKENICEEIQENVIKFQEDINYNLNNSPICECEMNEASRKSNNSFFNENGDPRSEEIYENIFKNVNCLLKMNFIGSVRVHLKIELPKNITIQTDVYIKKISGDILVRFPSIDYNTRLEYTFVSHPDFDIAIEAGLFNQEGKGYFKKTISNFLRRAIKYTFNKIFLYPSFNSLILPLIVSTFKNYEYKFTEIDENSKEHLFYETKEKLSLFLLMDYKIFDVFDGITLRKSNYLINDKEKITCGHFKISELVLQTFNSPSSKNYIYKGLTIKESKIMNQIYDLSIFNGVISRFRDCKTTKQINSETSIVELFFEDSRFEFIRIVLTDGIIFQRNSKHSPEFIIFKITNKELFIYHYTFTSSFCMTRNRIIKLKNKLSLKPVKKGGLSSVYKMFKLSKIPFSYFSKSIKNPDEKRKGGIGDVVNLIENIEYPELLGMFQESINNIHECKFCKTYFINSPIHIINQIIQQDEVRLRILCYNAKVYKLLSENPTFRSIAIENSDDKGEDFVLHTYSEKNIIIDIIDNKRMIFCLDEVDFLDGQAKEINSQCVESNVVSLNSINNEGLDTEKAEKLLKINRIKFKNDILSERVIVGPGIGQSYPNLSDEKRTRVRVYVDDRLTCISDDSFIKSIHTRIKQQEYVNIASQIKSEKIQIGKEMKKEFYGDIGGVYIEFMTEYPDDFKLVLFSSAFQRNILEIQKIITSKPFRMVLPFVEEDIILMRLIPKYKKNRTVELKIINLPDIFKNESLIDCNIGLSKNSSFIYPVSGSSDYIIFWEKEPKDSVKGYIENPYTTVTIEGNGYIRTDNSHYCIIYKNKGSKCRDIKVYMGLTLRE